MKEIFKHTIVSLLLLFSITVSASDENTFVDNFDDPSLSNWTLGTNFSAENGKLFTDGWGSPLILDKETFKVGNEYTASLIIDPSPSQRGQPLIFGFKDVNSEYHTVSLKMGTWGGFYVSRFPPNYAKAESLYTKTNLPIDETIPHELKVEVKSDISHFYLDGELMVSVPTPFSHNENQVGVRALYNKPDVKIDSFTVTNTVSKIATKNPVLLNADIVLSSSSGDLVSLKTDWHGKAEFAPDLLNPQLEYTLSITGGKVLSGAKFVDNHAEYKVHASADHIKNSEVSTSIFLEAVRFSVKHLKGKVTADELDSLKNKAASGLFKPGSVPDGVSSYDYLKDTRSVEFLLPEVIAAAGAVETESEDYQTLAEAFAKEDRDVAYGHVLNAFSNFIEFNNRNHEIVKSTSIKITLMGQGSVFSDDGISLSSEDIDFKTVNQYLVENAKDGLIYLSAEPKQGYEIASWVGCVNVVNDVCEINKGMSADLEIYFVQPELTMKTEVVDITGEDLIRTGDIITFNLPLDNLETLYAYESVEVGHIFAGITNQGVVIFAVVDDIISKDSASGVFEFLVTDSKFSEHVDNGTLYFNREITNHDVFKANDPTGNGVYSSGSIVSFDDGVGVVLSEDPESTSLHFISSASTEAQNCTVDEEGDSNCDGSYRFTNTQIVKATGEAVWENNDGELRAKVEFLGSVDLVLSIGGHYDISWGTLESASFWTSMKASPKAEIKVEGSYSYVEEGGGTGADFVSKLQQTNKKYFASEKIAKYIGTIPVMPPFIYASPKILLEMKAGVKLTGAMEYSLTTSSFYKSKSGVYYTKADGWDADGEDSYGINPAERSLKAKAEVKAEASIELGLGLDISQVEFPLAVYGRAALEGMISLPIESAGACSGIVDVSANFKYDAGIRTVWGDGIEVGFMTIPTGKLQDVRFAGIDTTVPLLKYKTPFINTTVPEDCIEVAYDFPRLNAKTVVDEFSPGIVVIPGETEEYAFTIKNTSNVKGSYALDFEDNRSIFSVVVYKKSGDNFSSLSSISGSVLTINKKETHYVKVSFNSTRFRNSYETGEASLNIKMSPKGLPSDGPGSIVKGATLRTHVSVLDYETPPSPKNLSINSKSSLRPTLRWEYPEELKVKYRSSKLRFKVYLNGKLYREVDALPAGYGVESQSIHLPYYGEHTVQVKAVTRYVEGGMSTLRFNSVSSLNGNYTGTWVWSCGFEWGDGSPSSGSSHMSVYLEEGPQGVIATYGIDGFGSGTMTLNKSGKSSVDGNTVRMRYHRGSVVGGTDNGIGCSKASGLAGQFKLSR